jgi:hypothetical protein
MGWSLLNGPKSCVVPPQETRNKEPRLKTSCISKLRCRPGRGIVSCFGDPMQQLIQNEETECKRSVHVPEPTTLPHNTHKSANSNIKSVRMKKTSKMVSPPDLVSIQNVVDVVKLDQEVSPRVTHLPLWYTYRFFLNL